MIVMIGIDYTTADVDTRSVFAFRKSEMSETMEQLRTNLSAEGIVLVSTCNRMELWVSSRKSVKDLLKTLCVLRGLDTESYRHNFVSREGEEAVRHLFMLTAGLKSAIVAENQILTQVKEAADFARTERLIDSSLEVLFRCAVTAGKRIKTEVAFHRGNGTAIEKAIQLVEEKFFTLKGRRTMVIGNGEYGRLAAAKLLAAGADVTVTIRQYHHGEVRIPNGAATIMYGDKYTLFPECDLVVSATSSPNYTLFYDKVAECKTENTKVLIDLAVPRDIDPEIRKLPGYILYNIDDFQSELSHENDEALKQADAIIDEIMEEFRVWSSYRDIIPLIDRIKHIAAEDILVRVEKPIHKLAVSDSEKDDLEKSIVNASGKVVANIFYYLRDTLDAESFRKCVRAAFDSLNELGENKNGSD